jgi:hypothetical protein
MLHPVGPLSPRVYWTRRLVLFAILAVILIAVAVSCAAGSGSGHPAASSTKAKAKPSTSSSPSASSAPAPCKRRQLAVTASTDAATYASGTLPRLRLTVRNVSAAACVLVESPSTRSWTVVSGPDQVWTNAGCNASHTASRSTLAAGGSVRHTFVWNRHRSGQNCATSTVTAAPGTYQLTATANGIASAPAVFHLTG